MPEMLKKSNGETDWNKLFMGFAIAFVFVMQQYHSMQVSSIKQEIVPRAEYAAHQENVMDKDIIIEALKKLGERMDKLEEDKL